MARIKAASFTVKEDLFWKGMKTFSGRILRDGYIKAPVRWENKWWIVSTAFVSHSKNEAWLYEAVPIDEWDGDIQVFGSFDENWIRQREASGMFWHGVKVQIEGDASGREFVLGAKIQWKVAASKPRGRRHEGS